MKFARRVGVVAALALGLAVAGPLGSVAGAAAKPKAVATLKIQAPSVSVKKKGASDFTPAKDGQKLHEGDTVQTDATGLAEVDYSDDSYTRLDVGTTLKIEKLSDDQGNRQVETSVDVGRTWNRTAALTESESFQQSGAGATAAVVGTAFSIQCDVPVAPSTVSEHCTTTGVVDNVTWTGADGTSINLNPLDACDSTNGVLCQNIAHLTPDQLGSWIEGNLYQDLVLRGLGPGPITGTLVIQNGQATFVPSTPATTTGGTTPTTPPGPAAAPVVDLQCPVVVDSTTSGSGACPPSSSTARANAITYVPASALVVEDEDTLSFNINATSGPSGLPYFVVFTQLPSGLGVFNYCDTATSTCNPIAVNTSEYDPTTGSFQIVPVANETAGPLSGSLTFHVTNHQSSTGDITVGVQVTEDACGPHEGTTCQIASSVAPSSASAMPATDPTATQPTDPPTTTPSTSETTTSTSDTTTTNTPVEQAAP